MMKRALLLFSVVSLAAAADKYHVDLYQPTVINGTTFKPGEANLELKDNKVVLKQGKTTVEVDVKVESNNDKYAYTTVGYTAGENHKIKDISLGGTHTHIVFGQAASVATAPEE